MKKVIVLVGPTAVGKTDLSIALAKKLDTEIISADSVQIYKGLDIGSAKPTTEEQCGIIHHLIDHVSPFDAYSVSEYAKQAFSSIDALIERGKIPIVAGGTGLYVNALLYDMNFGESLADVPFRTEMERLAEAEGNEAVHLRLRAVDPEAAERIHVNNLRRVIRALEVNHITGKPMADFAVAPQKNEHYQFQIYGLTRPRDVLYDRINRRVHLMLQAGLIDEVKRLKSLGLDDSFQSMQGIGYKEVLAYLDGKISMERMVEIIQQFSRNYAKRQMTWFKRYEDIIWLDLEVLSTDDAVLKIIEGLSL